MIPLFRKAMKYNGNAHIVFDGNSLFTGSPSVPDLAVASAPVSGSGTTSANVAIAGQTWRMMNGQDGGSTTDVNGAFSASRQNVLVLWEHTNAICNVGSTANQCYQDMLDYIAARRAVSPGCPILVLGTIPRQGFTLTAAYSNVKQINAALQQVDLLVQQNAAAIGVEFMSLRQPGSVFNFSGFDEADFAASGDIWVEGVGARVHLNNSGKALVAERVVLGLQRLVL